MKQRAVRTFHEKYRFPSGKFLKDQNESWVVNLLFKLICKWNLFMIKCFQGYANKRQEKRGDYRLYRFFLHLEEVSEGGIALMNKDELELADSLGDLLYVTYGTADTYTIPLDSCFWIIHEANMTKKLRNLDNLRLRDKGSDWKAPDIKKCIIQHREEA